ncbi:endoplasmic reticulum-Golgi intermediate compartment protein 2-like isoform X2 [Ruditapes philippinarum]|uniref:endoplasmic reticulum-Golgi intermediate compartment protein 2-like isoform X2 n=1 Tax=Ruditapes philippinarum TaxID=129788 RepID=UPI00295B4DCE|nr:endoplasmic reticulum-Golgi intermediate compartment protein 2-like isoform X2 [Ruditapes philippinarum]
MRRAAVASKSPTSKALKVVKELDAFPKVPDNFKETTVSGGGISVVTFVFIAILMISEVRYYANTLLKFDYEVDKEVDGKIKINVDMTVAMRCEHIGADVLDQTGQDTHSFGSLKMDNTHYELSPRQQQYHEITQQVNQYMRDEYHAIQELMWLSGHQPALKMGMPKREIEPEGPADACRIHGTLEVNKVAGNFHITAGKSVPVIPRGHAHLAMMLRTSDYNFTHRIDHFSFGDQSGGVINPLDGEEQLTTHNYHLYQYFMKIVPTEVRTYSHQVDTYQYSVTERSRPINHASGSHGVPGIFVKYDVFAFKIRVREELRPFWQFLVRLCGIAGGVFVVSGLLHDSVGVIVDVLCCRFKVGKYNQEKKGETLLSEGSESDLLKMKENSLYTDYDQTYNPVHLAEQSINSNSGNLNNGQDLYNSGDR